MKKYLKVFSLVLILSFVVILSGCGKGKAIKIWVGTECEEFYQGICDEYIAQYNSTHEKAFPYKIEVKGVDAGSAAQQYLNDTEVGPDIFTIPHDNLAKLTTGSSAIAPVTDSELLAQIQNDNPETFINATKATVGGSVYQFGVPYISQALVYYYNNEHLTEKDVENWETISQKAKSLSVGKEVKAALVLGTDGYNNSFNLLAKYYDEEGNLCTSLKLYPNGTTDNYATGDDTIASLKWGRKYFQMAGGGIDQAGSSGWEQALKDGFSLGLIGGAWNYQAAKAALGSKLGVAVLPKFTITAAEAYGSIEAGTVFQSGTFVDCKCFVMKKNSKYADYIQDIVKYLSSKEIQEKAFVAVANCPAYKNANNEFNAMKADTLDAKLAQCQIQSFDFGIPQPFGASNTYNFWYYSKGTPEKLYALLKNSDNLYPDDASILKTLEKCVKTWSTGKND